MDDLYTHMPEIVKNSGRNKQFKSHDKTIKCSMTAAEAAERDANNREQVTAQEARLRATEALILSSDPGPICLIGPMLTQLLPPASTEPEMVLDTPS